ncbi:ABC transporter permease [Georgenia sp. AZ-5]|uniref:ABC transporter permease n=1 Tax=Georgenia sp. AZ-5 TaxID=3367526 RepID=UPI0037541742
MSQDDVGLLLRTAVGLAVVVGLTMGLQRWGRLPTGARPLTAVLRAALQLGVIALVLRGVLTWPALVAAFVALMLTTASLTSGSRLGELWSGRRAALAAVLVGGLVSTAVVLALGLVPFDARNVVAVGGILIGNSMSAATLSGRNFRTMALARAGEVEAWLALGAPPRRAFEDVARNAVHEALLPTLDQTRSTGLVTLPGAFVGALFGGAGPIEAARFQLVVLAGIMLTQTLTGLTVTRILSAAPLLPTAAAPSGAAAQRRKHHHAPAERPQGGGPGAGGTAREVAAGSRPTSADPS